VGRLHASCSYGQPRNQRDRACGQTQENCGNAIARAWSCGHEGEDGEGEEVGACRRRCNGEVVSASGVVIQSGGGRGWRGQRDVWMMGRVSAGATRSELRRTMHQHAAAATAGMQVARMPAQMCETGGDGAERRHSQCAWAWSTRKRAARSEQRHGGWMGRKEWGGTRYHWIIATCSGYG